MAQFTALQKKVAKGGEGFIVISQEDNFEQNLVGVGVSKVKNKNPQRKELSKQLLSFPPNLRL